MSTDQVIEKIRKLLRMRRGGTPSEVETALSLAAELARKHGVDLGSVDPDVEPEEVITHVEVILGTRLPLEAKFAAAILVNFFNVGVVVAKVVDWRVFKHKRAVRLVGSKWDIDVGWYVFVYLQRAFRRAWAERENKRLKNREAFMHGMFVGLAAKLEAERKAALGGNEAGLVLIGRAMEKRNRYIAEHWETQDVDLDRDGSNASHARMAGLIAGQKTELRKGMKGAPLAERRQLAGPVGAMCQGELSL